MTTAMVEVCFGVDLRKDAAHADGFSRQTMDLLRLLAKHIQPTLVEATEELDPADLTCWDDDNLVDWAYNILYEMDWVYTPDKDGDPTAMVIGIPLRKFAWDDTAAMVHTARQKHTATPEEWARYFETVPYPIQQVLIQANKKPEICWVTSVEA